VATLARAAELGDRNPATGEALARARALARTLRPKKVAPVAAEWDGAGVWAEDPALLAELEALGVLRTSGVAELDAGAGWEAFDRGFRRIGRGRGEPVLLRSAAAGWAAAGPGGVRSHFRL
jgi:hypothetical protein